MTHAFKTYYSNMTTEAIASLVTHTDGRNHYFGRLYPNRQLINAATKLGNVKRGQKVTLNIHKYNIHKI